MHKFTKGLVFGSLVGAVGGLFLAPRSGKETRQRFVDELDEWSDLKEDFSEKLEQVKLSAAVLQEAAEIYVEPFIDGLQQDIDTFKFQAEPRMAQIKEQVTKIQEELPEFPTQNTQK